MTPSKYAQIRIDKYSLGFHTRYYKCESSSLTRYDKFNT